MTAVCASISLGPFNMHHSRFDSIDVAVKNFHWELEKFYGTVDKGIVERTGAEYAPTMDLYPQCRDCNSHMNFHDWPMARYQVGPRGGIRRIRV